jgi:hypothetical protein
MLRAGQPLDHASAWVTVLCYSFQLYYDFSGYSDMAIGLARMFGFRLPVNFYSPYKSTSIIDFWRRWHITLSRFLRDYLYIPLGGNRRGPVRRYLNLGIVMLLGGLWHGANWTFVVWGAVHGLMLALNHAWRAIPFSSSFAFKTRAAERIATFTTFVAVTLAWIPFRADSLADARTMMSYLWTNLAGREGLASLWGSIESQFGELKYVFTLRDEWFRPRDLWPSVLPANYLATETRPLGLLLLCLGVATFAMPNTYQIFGRFEPALGLPEETPYGALSRLDWRVSLIIAAIISFSQYNEVVAERPADNMKYWNDALHLSTNLGRLMLRSFLGASDVDTPSNLLRELTPATVEAILRERRAEMARWVAENPAYPAAFDQAKAEWRQDRSR